MEPAQKQIGWLKRQRVWRHNSFFGHVQMAKANMHSIVDSPTTTKEAKDRASFILVQLGALAQHLKDRIDV